MNTKCPCGCVLVPVPTCGGCGEQWIGQREAVLLDASKARSVPCANAIPGSPTKICALWAGHAGECATARPAEATK